jgi:hypothetical protein
MESVQAFMALSPEERTAVHSETIAVPDAFPLIQKILSGQMSGPLPGNLVLDAGEVATIRATVDQYNAFIALQAQAHGAALVDIHALTNQLRDHGFVTHGQRLTTDFLGGLFSLDGTHPSNTGYGLFANEFIHVINTNFAAGIPPVNIEKIASADPLVLAGVGHAGIRARPYQPRNGGIAARYHGPLRACRGVD